MECPRPPHWVHAAAPAPAFGSSIVARNGGILIRRGQSRVRGRGDDDSLLLGFHEEVLEIEERLFGRLHVDKCRRDSRLTRPSRPSNLMDIVLHDISLAPYDDRSSL